MMIIETHEIHFTDAVLVFGTEQDGTLFFEWQDKEPCPLPIPKPKSGTFAIAGKKCLATLELAELLNKLGMPPDDIEKIVTSI